LFLPLQGGGKEGDGDLAECSQERKKEFNVMALKIVNTTAEPGMTYGEELLDPSEVTLKSGRWVSEEDLIANTRDADGIICASPIQYWTPRILKGLSRCRIIATISIGYDRISVETATQMGIVVTNIPDYCIDEVSNQAICFIMALGRRLLAIDKAVKEKQVFFHPGNRKALAEVAHPIFRLRDQTLGIIGLGKIGTAVALKAKGLGLRVIAYDPYVLGAVMFSRGVEPADLDTLLRESDFISLHAILNDETRGMIGSEQFRKMKPTCYVVNTARADILRQPDLITALERGLIAGAGLDVTTDEPISSDNPLVKLPNVLLTGHSAWYSTASDSPSEYWHKPMTQVFMALKGRWPTYAVNPEVKQKWLERWVNKV
jgi:D-3-phosphoglycerate dehydrogenase